MIQEFVASSHCCEVTVNPRSSCSTSRYHDFFLETPEHSIVMNVMPRYLRMNSPCNIEI
jgi:hypothetical protein